jgi:hypothetical protein
LLTNPLNGEFFVVGATVSRIRLDESSSQLIHELAEFICLCAIVPLTVYTSNHFVTPSILHYNLFILSRTLQMLLFTPSILHCSLSILSRTLQMLLVTPSILHCNLSILSRKFQMLLFTPSILYCNISILSRKVTGLP